MASLSKDRDSNICNICENIINRVYGIGISPNIANNKHFKPLHKQLTKSGLTKKSRSKKGLEKQITIGELAIILNSKYKFLENPIHKESNKELLKILKIIADELSRKIDPIKAEKRIINNLKASIINPINRMEYGNNAPSTIKIKGFNKPIVDTGQIINKIDAWRIEWKFKNN